MYNIQLTSEERIKLALQHKEPDRIPFDLGSTLCTRITVGAYKNLLSYLRIKKGEVSVIDVMQQLAGVDEDVLEKLSVDTRGLIPNAPSSWKLNIKQNKRCKYYTDQWGIRWKMPRKGAYYYDMYYHPLAGKVDKQDINNYPWPDPTDLARIEGLRDNAQVFAQKGKAIVMNPIGGGFFESSFWLRGFQDFYIDLGGNLSLTCYLTDKLLEIRMAYWEMVPKELGEYILVIMETDDLGSQDRTIISPEMYRKYVKPRQKKLFSYIKKTTPHVYILFHSCGSVYDIIPDLIEVG